MSSLTVEDCIAYRDVLWDLGRVTPELWSRKFNIEQARWLGPRGTPRWSQFWRPFEGPLAPGSQKLALVVIQSPCQWLTDHHYLHGNPFQSVGKLAKRADRIDVTRAFTLGEWKLIKTHLGNMTIDARYWRLRLILLLAYSSDARLSELASMRRQHLRRFEREDTTDQQWKMQVTGKSDVTRELHLPLFVMNELRHYFRQRGYSSLEQAPPNAPLIAGLEGKERSGTVDVPLSAARLYDVIKGFFTEVANQLPASKYESAERIRRASTHWLRHTFAMHFLRSGGELAILFDLLAHKSLATTSVYVTTERDNRSRAMEKFGNLAVL